ncbi:hypothetical protein BS47DRAFT_1332970 [Hydnum rufescens UP504]|uniref:Rgp1-domain-containing protein n=1 Tax=Hydnum rufescens UP504 TaxID=1448309 RepID=A0A9P6DR33_9AGAM|nr:hypothetical protein BS47DRAFT_1332970 [Hydnum rufescens UP504]
MTESSGIQVTVSPSQSAYFAGELFNVSITFTNMNDPSMTYKASTSHMRTPPTHRRSAHSIAYPSTVTSIPLNTPISTGNSTFPSGPLLPRRKGLIGKSKLPVRRAEINDVSSEFRVSGTPDSRQKHNPKAQSLSTFAIDTAPKVGGSFLRTTLPKLATIPSPPPPRNPAALTSTSSSRNSVSPSISRANSSRVIPSTHPHARKQSVHESQSYVHDVYPQAGPSAYTVSLDPINETSSPDSYVSSAGPATPTFMSERPFVSTGSKLSPVVSVPRRRSSLIGYGPPPGDTSPGSPTPRSAFSSTFTSAGTELLLWAYARFAGTIELDTTVVPSSEADFWRSKLREGGAVGGGQLDMGLSRPSSGGLLSSFFSGPPSTLVTPSTSRFSPLLSSLFSPTPRSSGLGRSPFMGGPGAGLDDGLGIPTFETQPSILVVDLSLAPGESRTYTYSIPLPSVLPPTYRGRAVKFSYNLIIGTSTSKPSVLPTSMHETNQRNRILRVPIRVYNHIAVGRPPRPYDVLWPVARRKENPLPAKVEERRKPMVPKTTRASARLAPKVRVAAEELGKLKAYGGNLLRGAPHVNGNGRSARSEGSSDENEFGEERYGCRESVEVLTRNPKKVSYDIAKDGEPVAILTFVKSAYRLGESILGVIDFNFPPGRTKVLKFCASLEAYETLPPSIPTHQSRNHLKRVHSEFLCSLTADTRRISFSLDIPADGTPAFHFTAHDPKEAVGGLDWKVRLCFLVALEPEGEMWSMLPDGPKGEWGTSSRAGDSLAPLRLIESASANAGAGGWTSMFLGGVLETTMRITTGRWQEVDLHTVECEVDVVVFPGATAFRPVESSFDA